MNLKHLSDQCLLDETKKLVSKERELVTAILHHLREVERRRLFCHLGRSSLFAYCTEVLRYSEAQAQQKISAMRLMREIPELQSKLEKGEISVTNVAQAASFFRQQAKATNAALPVEKKKEVLKKLESTSTRQGQRILLSLSSQPKAVVIEKEKPVTEDLTEIRFVADDKLLAKLKRLKGLMAHKKACMSYNELINELCEIGLAKLDPVRKAERAKRLQQQRDEARKVGPAQNTLEATAAGTSRGSALLDTASTSKGTTSLARRSEASRSLQTTRAIAASERHQAWLRAKGHCENCGSQHALQMDHRKPYALGGDSRADNIRILCRWCNQRAAIESFGLQKMQSHICPS